MKDPNLFRLKSAEAVRFIEKHMAENGNWPPTQAQIARGIGYSSTGRITDLLRQMAAQGMVRFRAEDRKYVPACVTSDE